MGPDSVQSRLHSCSVSSKHKPMQMKQEHMYAWSLDLEAATSK